MKKFFFFLVLLFSFNCVLADKTADTINYVVNDSITITTIIKASTQDYLTPPPEVQWSIAGLIILILFVAIITLRLKKYK